MKPALVVLAAGASRRLGTCKALVDLGGATPLERLCAAGRAAGHEDLYVVGGAHDALLRAALPADVEYLHNERWSEGRTTTVLTAARALEGRDLTLAPVDVPRVPERVFRALLEVWRGAGSPPGGWLAPRHGERHGHPIVAGRALLLELADVLAHDPAASLRDLRRRADPLLEVVVTAPEVLEDLDTPADLARLRALAAGGESV